MFRHQPSDDRQSPTPDAARVNDARPVLFDQAEYDDLEVLDAVPVDGGPSEHLEFDKVVIATHANAALALLTDVKYTEFTCDLVGFNGGFNPKLPLHYYCDLFRAVRERYADRLEFYALTIAEFMYLADRAGRERAHLVETIIDHDETRVKVHCTRFGARGAA